MLSNTDFYTGAFPAEFGNALSGVMDLNLRQGNSDKREYTIRCRNIRTCHSIFSSDHKHIGNFTLFGIGGISSLGNTVSGDSTDWKSFADRSEDNLAQKIGVVGMTHNYLFHDRKTQIKSVITVSGTTNVDGADTVSNQFVRAPQEANSFSYVYVRAASYINRKVDIQKYAAWTLFPPILQLLPAGSTPDPNQNRHLDFSRAAHAVVGFNYSFFRDYRIKIEAYYQYLFSVPVGVGANSYFSVLNLNDGFANFPMQSTGVGYNYGIELTLEKFFSNNFYFMYTLSLFDSKYRATDDVWRNTTYDNVFVTNLLGGKEFV
ncbi:unnamed protein product [Sphagnum jensenii]|uniref:DUF3570 domain-containing protein n=1 Tax=Sphagnum jensenii TaxID=128206 RepID=A0ABP0V782_9BRYO